MGDSAGKSISGSGCCTIVGVEEFLLAAQVREPTLEEILIKSFDSSYLGLEVESLRDNLLFRTERVIDDINPIVEGLPLWRCRDIPD